MKSASNISRLQQNQQTFRNWLTEIVPGDGNRELSARMSVFRRSEAGEVNHGESSLALCMIAEGSKQVLLGDSVYTYDKDHYLVTSMQLPTSSFVTMANTESPYLGLRLLLDPAMVRSMLMSHHHDLAINQHASAFDVADVDADLLDAVIRLLRTTTSPQDAEVLSSLIEREIIYRLLSGNHGGRLAHIAGLGPTTQGVTRAISRIRKEYDHPLRIPEIAQDCGMSVSSFHDHFKRATGMTPLQFQKHLRLREARRLLLNEDIDVAGAGFRVGYNDASHFNRDYKKLFGRSPMRDMESLRAAGPLAVAPN